MRQTAKEIIGEMENGNVQRKMLSSIAINNRMMSVKRVIKN
jgi:hypothetical protein